jgi:hypothetical protein
LLAAVKRSIEKVNIARKYHIIVVVVVVIFIVILGIAIFIFYI